MSVVGAVMAGGRSTRFGRDKALLTVHGQTLLERTVATLRRVTGEVLVLGPPERASQVSGVEVARIFMPGIGPLGGIYTALQARPGSAVIVVAVDMPFLNSALLCHLVELSDEADVVLPVVDGRGQQLHAVYGPGCLPHVERQIATGDYKIDRFFHALRVRRVEEAELRVLDPGCDSFRNVNTPELWEQVLRELQGGGGGAAAS